MSDVVERIGNLLARLQSPDFYEREEAVKELGTFTEDEALAGLVMALEDSDLGIRELAADQLSAVGGQTASQLLIRFMANDDIGTRNLACEILVRIGEDAVMPLIENLTDDDHDVRKFIVDVLGLIKDKRAVEPLCQRLWDESGNVVCSAAEALGEIGSAEANPHLIAVCDKTEDAKLQAVEALGKIGDPSVLTKLYEMLVSDDPMIQYVVIEAIGQICDIESIPHLVKILEAGDKVIADVALLAIIRISNANSGRIEYDLPMDDVADFLFEGIKSRDKDVTDFTLERLTHWYNSDVIDKLLSIIDYVDEDRLPRIIDIVSEIGPVAGKLIIQKIPGASKEGKLRLLSILKVIINDDLAEQATECLKDEDPEVRQRVTQVLGVSGHTGAVAAIKKLTSDPNGHVRAGAYSALGWLCNESDVDDILPGLDDKYPDVREAAVGALIIIGGPKVIAKLNADIFHEGTERQRLAVTALGWLGEQDVVEPLLRAINHPDAGIRKSAISSLTRIGNVDDMEPIKLALTDENSGVRKVAVTALIVLRGEECISDIRQLLDDDDIWVRYHTITGIGEMRIKKYADCLLPYLEDDLDVIKIAAAKAMALLGDERAVPVLNRLKQEKNTDLVDAAESALSNIGGNK